MKWLYLFLLVVSLEASTKSQQHFIQGNQFYEKGQYIEAEEAFLSAHKEGLVHPHLYYNLGNTYFRLNKIGQAILFYEMAYKIAPMDKDIEANLKFARTHITDKVEVPPPNVLTQWLYSIHTSYSLSIGLWVFCGLISLGFLFLIIRIYLRSSPARVTFLIPSLLSFALAFLFIISLGKRVRDFETKDQAVVIETSLALYSGPGQTYQLLATVHEGTKFQVEEKSKEWARVKLPNGQGGWVLTNGLGIF